MATVRGVSHKDENVQILSDNSGKHPLGVRLDDLNILLFEDKRSSPIIAIWLVQIDPELNTSLSLGNPRAQTQNVLTFAAPFRSSGFLDAAKEKAMRLELFSQIANLPCISLWSVVHRQDIGSAEAQLDLDVSHTMHARWAQI
jgi:hypothetical protein